MKQSSQITGGTSGHGRNISRTTDLPSSAATNIRGTSIAKSVTSSQTRLTLADPTDAGDARIGPQVGPRDAVERTS